MNDSQFLKIRINSENFLINVDDVIYTETFCDIVSYFESKVYILIFCKGTNSPIGICLGKFSQSTGFQDKERLMEKAKKLENKILELKHNSKIHEIDLNS